MYLVVELQTSNGSMAQIPYVKSTRDEAESKYHEILAYAATSSIEVHSAVIINEEGQKIKSECYKHEVNNNV